MSGIEAWDITREAQRSQRSDRLRGSMLSLCLRASVVKKREEECHG